MDKKGQFFIIAALILVSVIFGLGTIYNTASAPVHDSKVFSLAEDIKYESAQIMNNGLFLELNQSQINKNVKNITNSYAASNPDVNLIVVYGKKGEMNYTYYAKGSEQALDSSNNVTIQNDLITISLSPNIKYLFNVTKGQNIYVAVKKEVNEERYVTGI